VRTLLPYIAVDPARKAKESESNICTVHCRINVTDVISIGMEKGKSEMNPAKYSVVTADNSYHGAIKVGITFTAATKVKKLTHCFVQFV
jgi:hypothetical protein